MAISARARELFLAELASRDITPTELEDGAYEVTLGSMTITVNLENKGREFDETGDEEIIKHFVDTILGHADILPTSWEQARRRVYWAAEPADHDFGDICREEVSDQVCLVLAYQSDPGEHLVWLTPGLLSQMGVSRELAEAHAVDNLARLLDETPINTEDADGHKLGIFATSSPLKAALIFARNLREKVEPILGWPIFAVIPNRDFAYLIPESAQEIFAGIGKVVIGEHTTRGYPLSTEMFRIDSDKVEAVGEFQSPLNPPRGMKAIHHDNLLTFFLPEEWEECEDDDELIYFDPIEEDNYLSVTTQLYHFEEGLPDGIARRSLEPIAEEEGIEVEDWPGDRALVHFTGEHEGMRTWTWAIAGPATSHHLALAVFTYNLPAEEAESEESQARIEMLGEMLPRALFRGDAIQEEEEEDEE